MEHVGVRIALAPCPFTHGYLQLLHIFSQRVPRRTVRPAALYIRSSSATVRKTASTGGMNSTALRVASLTSAVCWPLGSTEYSLCFPETTCSAMRYQCQSGNCLPKKNAKCDSVVDCQDGSDEADCGEIKCSNMSGGPQIRCHIQWLYFCDDDY